jgi:hypothetical protein
MPKVQRHWVAAGLVLGLAACAPAAQQEDFGFAQPAASEQSTILVKSDYFGETDIYALTGSTRIRLGTVRTGGTAELRIPAVIAGRAEIQLQADPVGPNAPFTFPVISLRPGHTMELVLTSSLPMSTLVW